MGWVFQRRFTDADFVRLEANLTRGDSLEVISNDAYQRAYEKMQQESMGPVLAMVLAGGWLESMHLVMRQIAGVREERSPDGARGRAESDLGALDQHDGGPLRAMRRWRLLRAPNCHRAARHLRPTERHVSPTKALRPPDAWCLAMTSPWN